MADFLGQLTTIGGEIFTTVGTVCSTIVSTPLLLLTVGFLFVGGAIGIVGRLLSRS